MRNTTVTVGPLAVANASNIAATQSPGAGAIILNGSAVFGGLATLDKPRRVLLTSGGNDSAITFTVTGLDWNLNRQVETIVGANAGAVYTLTDFLSVLNVTHTGTVAGTLTIGTNGIASSRPIILDEYAFPQVGLQVNVAGTINYTVESSFDDPNQPNPRTMASSGVADFVGQGYQACVFLASSDANVKNATATAQSSFVTSPKMVRVTLNSGAGMATMRVQQMQRT